MLYTLHYRLIQPIFTSLCDMRILVDPRTAFYISENIKTMPKIVCFLHSVRWNLHTLQFCLGQQITILFLPQKHRQYRCRLFEQFIQNIQQILSDSVLTHEIFVIASTKLDANIKESNIKKQFTFNVISKTYCFAIVCLQKYLTHF